LIQVQLFRFGRLHAESHAETAKGADQAVDRLITEVLQGKHGTGEFEIDAVHVSEAGTSLGLHYASGQFLYPTPPRIPKPA
jgi:hypothetical protein